MLQLLGSVLIGRVSEVLCINHTELQAYVIQLFGNPPKMKAYPRSDTRPALIQHGAAQRQSSSGRFSIQPTRPARSFGSVTLLGRAVNRKEALCPDANQWRDQGFRRVDQGGEVEDRKVKRSHCQKRRAKTNREEKGERGRMDQKIQIKTRAALFSVICRPVCGFWIHSMASLAPARSGTPLMMFCNQVL